MGKIRRAYPLSLYQCIVFTSITLSLHIKQIRDYSNLINRVHLNIHLRASKLEKEFQINFIMIPPFSIKLGELPINKTSLG